MVIIDDPPSRWASRGACIVFSTLAKLKPWIGVGVSLPTNPQKLARRARYIRRYKRIRRSRS